MFLLILSGCLSLGMAEGAVLDPALYLSPSPPFTSISNTISPGELWTHSVQTRPGRDAHDLSVIPINRKKEVQITEPAETMEEAETFWPGLRTAATANTQYTLKGIHIPLTFSLTGTYGRYGTSGSTGIIGSSYASISGNSGLYGDYEKSGLAGSGYGSYGTGYPGVRIYGGNRGATWSGWGNGKWGHYGKG